MKDNSNDLFSADGVVVEILPDFHFNIKLDNGHVVFAKGSGRLRKNRVRISISDRVSVEISRYDITKGRIMKRY